MHPGSSGASQARAQVVGILYGIQDQYQWRLCQTVYIFRQTGWAFRVHTN